MKTSHIVLISATSSAAFVIGLTHAPQTTYTVFAFFAYTIIFTMLITFAIKLIKESNY